MVESAISAGGLRMGSSGELGAIKLKAFIKVGFLGFSNAGLLHPYFKLIVEKEKLLRFLGIIS